MKKKYILLLIILFITFLNGCGYEPIYSSKDFLFKINKITHSTSKIDTQIARSLKAVSNDDSMNVLDLSLKSEKKKKIISKDKNGDPEIFELQILIDIRIKETQKLFMGKQVYNNIENKFELNEYVIQLEKQIIDKLIDQIIIFFIELE